MKNISILEAEFVDDWFGNVIMEDKFDSGTYFSNASTMKNFYYLDTGRLIDNASHAMGELRDDIFILNNYKYFAHRNNNIPYTISEMKRRYRILKHYYPREWFITAKAPGSSIRPIKSKECNDIYPEILDGRKVLAKKRDAYADKVFTKKYAKTFKKKYVAPLLAD